MGELAGSFRRRQALFRNLQRVLWVPVIAFVLSGCGEDAKHRFRLAIDLSFDGKSYSSSGVLETRYYKPGLATDRHAEL